MGKNDTAADKWTGVRIPMLMGQAIDKFLETDVCKQNGIVSRAEFVTRLLSAFFANFQKDFGLFVPKNYPISPVKRVSDDWLKFQKNVIIVPAEDITDLLSTGILSKKDVVERKNLIAELRKKGFFGEEEEEQQKSARRD
jgi:hypothetical protein